MIGAMVSQYQRTGDIPGMDDESSGIGGLITGLAPFAAWYFADRAKGKASDYVTRASARTGLSAYQGFSKKLMPYSKYSAMVEKKVAGINTYGVMEREATGEKLFFGRFINKTREVERIVNGAAAKSAFKSEAAMLFGASRTAAFLGKGLELANAGFLIPMVWGMTYNGFKGIQRLGFELERPGHRLTLNSMAFTDRQRSIQAMHNSEFSGRSAMGQEAFLYHQ